MTLAEFKFKIGDVLRHVARKPFEAVAETDDKYRVREAARLTHRFIVNGRIAEECSGGTQIKYIVRGITESSVSLESTMHEHELCKEGSDA